MSTKAFKVCRYGAALTLSLGLVLAILILSSRELRPWNRTQIIGVDGRPIASIYQGQSANEKFAQLLRSLPAVAQARIQILAT